MRKSGTVGSTGLGSTDEPYLRSTRCLIVVFRPALTLAIVKGYKQADLHIQGDLYLYQPSFGDFTGFYDWLRDSEDRLLGLRYLPFERTISSRNLPSYVTRDPNSSAMEIFFTDRREYIAELSGDQAFGNNGTFRSATGDY